MLDEKRPDEKPGGGDVYATGLREGRLASLDPRMTSLEARIGSDKSQNVNKAAATAAMGSVRPKLPVPAH